MLRFDRGFTPIVIVTVIALAIVGITVFATSRAKSTSSQARETPTSFHSLSDFIHWLQAGDDEELQMGAMPFEGEQPATPTPTRTVTPTPWGRGECRRGDKSCDGNFRTECVNGSMEHISYCSYGCEGYGVCRTSPAVIHPGSATIQPTTWGKGECAMGYKSCDGDFTTECVNGSIERIYYCKNGCSSGTCIE